MRRGWAVAAVVAALLSASACGDDKSDVAAAAHKFFTAFADADSAALCSDLTAESQKALDQQSGGCATGFDTLFARADRSQLRAVGDLDIDKSQIVVSGDHAEIPASAAAFPGSNGSEGLTLVKQNGLWKVEIPK